MSPLVVTLGRSSEGGERLVPEAVEIGAQRSQALRVQLVQPPGAVRPVEDKARVLEHSEVLGDRGPADRQPASQLAHRLGAFREQLEEGAPGGVGQSREPISVSRHER
jgi:hypothetical protein